MTVHTHTYFNIQRLIDFAGGYALSVSDFQSMKGVTRATCPSGHTNCQGSGGSLQTWKSADVIWFEKLTTSSANSGEGHTHTYKRISVSAHESGYNWAWRNIYEGLSCDLDPLACKIGNITTPEYTHIATAAEVIDTETSPAIAAGSHSHDGYKSWCVNLLWLPLIGLTTCSLGHAGCQAIAGEAINAIVYPDVFTGMFDYWEEPVAGFSITTLSPGWTATLLTLAPPPYITESWALVRGDLQALEADYQGIYLGFDFGKTTDYGSQQWYNPPGGATKIYNPLLFSANLGGLAPGNNYHYRAKATLYDVNSVLLRGSVTLSGEAEGLATTLSFEWGETESYGNTVFVKTASYSTTFSQVLVELDPEITYHYRAMAVNALDTVYGEDMEFTAAGIYYGEDQSFETLSGPPPVSPIFGVGNDYRSAKQGIENVADWSLARGYVDTEGNFQYESRFRRQV